MVQPTLGSRVRDVRIFRIFQGPDVVDVRTAYMVVRDQVEIRVLFTAITAVTQGSYTSPMRGVRHTSDKQIMEALRECKSVSAAARQAGCSRALIHKRAGISPEVRKALDDHQARRDGPIWRQGVPAPAQTVHQARQAVKAEEDPEFEAKLRRLGLGVLAQKARHSKVDRDAISAARYLVQLTAPPPEAPGKGPDTVEHGGGADDSSLQPEELRTLLAKSLEVA